MSIDAEKKSLRQQAGPLRRSLAEAAGPEFSTKLTAHFLAHFEVSTDVAIAGYWPLGLEANVAPLLSNLSKTGARCLLPVVVAKNEPLEFRAWQPGDTLARSDFGVAEPTGDKAVAVPDFLLVPLLAFDAAGYRLGYGGGYYDRTLADLRVRRDITAIGMAYAGQQVDSVPHDSFDQRLDWMITEAGIIKFNAEKN